MKKIMVFLFITLFSITCIAQAPSIFPDILFPTLDGTQRSSQELFAKKELNIVVFWAPNGYTIRQMKGIDQALDGWQKKYDLQIVIISMEMDLSKPKKAIERFVERGEYVHDAYTILLDEYVISSHEKTRRKYSEKVPEIIGTPHTLLVDKESKIVDTLKGYKPHSELEQKISNYFE
jgi:hypothetical protein